MKSRENLLKAVREDRMNINTAKEMGRERGSSIDVKKPEEKACSVESDSTLDMQISSDHSTVSGEQRDGYKLGINVKTIVEDSPSTVSMVGNEICDKRPHHPTPNHDNGHWHNNTGPQNQEQDLSTKAEPALPTPTHSITTGKTSFEPTTLHNVLPSPKSIEYRHLVDQYGWISNGHLKLFTMYQTPDMYSIYLDRLEKLFYWSYQLKVSVMKDVVEQKGYHHVDRGELLLGELSYRLIRLRLI
jgi:hypothetical protein